MTATDGAKASNITAVLARATMTDWNEGLLWYQNARAIATEIGHGDVVKGAGILAALSPQIGWTNTVDLARKNTGPRTFKRKGYFTVQLAKAAEIYAGINPWDVLKGPKERAFACNIAHGVRCVHIDPRDGVGHACVTVDRHALAIVYGHVQDTNVLDRAGVYENIADMYRDAANAAGYSVHKVQAITWLAWRREKGITG